MTQALKVNFHTKEGQESKVQSFKVEELLKNMEDFNNQKNKTRKYGNDQDSYFWN